MKSSLPHVDSILEDEEPKETAISTRSVRTRSEVSMPPDMRVRSVSTSKIYQGSGPRVTKKSSLGIKNAQSQSGLPGRDMYDWRSTTPVTPQRTRRIQKNRESMDLGDVMNGSEEGDESSPDPFDQSKGRGRLYPVSKATNDLISFLEDGPPPDIQPVRNATVSAISLAPTTKSAKSGSRLQRMISKLNLTKEDRLYDPSRGRGIGVVTSAPSTISSLRSDVPPVPIAMKPVPPPIPQLLPISPPSSSRTSSAEDDARSHTSRTDPKKMSVRKAVPAWERTIDQGLQTPHTGGEKTLPTPPTSASSPSPSHPHGHIQFTPTPALNGRETIGVTHNCKLCASPAAMPSPPPTGTEAYAYPLTRENGSGRGEQQNFQGTHRPRSTRPNMRPPTNDEQTNPYPTRRPVGRRSPPNGTVDHSQPIPQSPSLSEVLALDMRKLMSQATTADECRLLVDTFLTRAGIILTPAFSPIVDNTPPPDAEPLERTLVNYFLSADLDGSQLPQTQPEKAEVERHSTPSTPKQAQESDDAHLSTATLTDSAHDVYTQNMVSDAVAVVS